MSKTNPDTAAPADNPAGDGAMMAKIVDMLGDVISSTTNNTAAIKGLRSDFKSIKLEVKNFNGVDPKIAKLRRDLGITENNIAGVRQMVELFSVLNRSGPAIKWLIIGTLSIGGVIWSVIFWLQKHF